jgi:hypothetical protein
VGKDADGRGGCECEEDGSYVISTAGNSGGRRGARYGRDNGSGANAERTEKGSSTIRRHLDIGKMRLTWK